MRTARAVLHAAIQRPDPLPDCAVCGRPTKRTAHRANGGTCSRCAINSPAALFDATARAKRTPRDAR